MARQYRDDKGDKRLADACAKRGRCPNGDDCRVLRNESFRDGPVPTAVRFLVVAYGLDGLDLEAPCLDMEEERTARFRQ